MQINGLLHVMISRQFLNRSPWRVILMALCLICLFNASPHVTAHVSPALSHQLAATKPNTSFMTMFTKPMVFGPTVTPPTLAVPTGTVAVNATGASTLEYSLNGGPFQSSNTFSGLAPGLYNVIVRGQSNSSSAAPYSFSSVAIQPVNGTMRVSDTVFGVSPFQASAWSFDMNNNFAIVRRFEAVPATGTPNPITLPGKTITGANGVAKHPLTGEIYIILKLQGVNGRVLGKINTQTGVCSEIGNLGDNFASITFRSDGTLFGATGDGATVPETLYTINPATAAKTLRFAMGNGTDGEAICYNPDDDFIYHWSGGTTVVFEKFPASATSYVATNIPISGTTNGEVFGALYLGAIDYFGTFSPAFLTSNINSSFREWFVNGVVGSQLVNLPDNLRGLVREQCTSTITAGSSTDVCGGVLLTVTGGVGDYQWFKDGAPIPGETNATYTATVSGVYNCSYQDTCGVIAQAPVGVTVSTQVPTPSNAGPDQELCVAATTATLAANAPSVGTGVWSVVSGPSVSLAQFSSTASPTATFSPVGGPGAYTLRWTISNAPCEASTDDVVLEVQAPASAGPDQKIATSGVAFLAANPPGLGTGLWSVVSGPSTSLTQFSSTTSPTAMFTPAGGSGIYTLRWTINSAQCVALSDDVIVAVADPPTIAKAFSPSMIIAGETSTVTLTLSNPNSIGLVASFSDILSNMEAVGGPIGGTCSLAAPLNLVGNTTVLNFTGVALPNNGSCTVSFAIRSTVVGTHPNTASGVATDFTNVVGAPSNTASLIVNAPLSLTPASFGPLTAGQPVTQNFTASGGFGTKTVNLTGALPTGLTFSQSTNAGTISGTAEQTGSFPLMLTATDANASTVSISFTLVVGCPNPAATLPVSLPNGQGGATYTANVAAMPSGKYQYVVAGNFPNGLTLNSDTGAITGIPVLVGTFSFTITATRFGTCTSSRSYTITITCPVIDLLPKPTGLMLSAAFPLPTASAGTGYMTTITATPLGGNPKYALLIAPNNLPGGLTLNPNTGVISGTTMITGTFIFRIQATAFGTCVGSRLYSLKVIAPTALVSKAQQ